MEIHIPTMFLVIIVGSAVLAGAISFIAYRRDHSLVLWALALFMHTITYVLYSLRGQISDIGSIVVANTALSVAFALFVKGVFQFQQRKPSPWLVWLPVAFIAVGVTALLDNFSARVVFICLVLAAQSAQILIALLQKRRETLGRGQYLLLAGASLIIGVFLVRVAMVAAGKAEMLVLSNSNPVQSATFFLVIISMILLGLGLVVMTKERAEGQIQHLNAELESRILARTAELVTARAEAESANAVKTRFMSNISHEMGTPMHGVMGFADIGMKRARKADQNDLAGYFEKIAGSGARMQKLVESLLTLTQQAWDEHTQIAAEDLQNINLGEILCECQVAMSKAAASRQQTIVINDITTSAMMRGDPMRLRQAVEHLIGNALRYSAPESSVIVQLSDLPAAGSGKGAIEKRGLELQVIDEGCGIPEAELNAIFEPFYESSRTATGAGSTGLGLPLSRAIIERHGGSLKAINRPQGGAIFEVRLPVQS
jgi:signal transduction histidine kinase